LAKCRLQDKSSSENRLKSLAIKILRDDDDDDDDDVQISKQMHFNTYDLCKSHFSQQHVSAAAIVAIFRVKLLQEYKGTMWLILSSLHNN